MSMDVQHHLQATFILFPPQPLILHGYFSFFFCLFIAPVPLERVFISRVTGNRSLVSFTILPLEGAVGES